MKKLLLISSLLLINFNLYCGEYCVSNIPDSLLENASAVIREHHTELVFRNETRAREKVKEVITIMERKKEGLADLFIHHDPYIKIKNYSGTIYDADGNKIRDLKKSDFIDRSSVPGFALYGDSRKLFTDIYMSQFPFTVEFNYEVDHREIYLNEIWRPVYSTGVSLQEASYSITTPTDMTFRYKAYNELQAEPEISHDKKSTTYKWTASALKAIKYESYMPPLSKMLPYVVIAADDFEYHNYRGNMSSWSNYASWISKLNQDKQELPASTVQEVKTLVEGIDDPKEKAMLVYEYMQSKTRYVSISLGIGGLQPFSAETTDNNGYGDCKALSNYTMALLAEVGVKSYYTLILSGNYDFQPDPEFPANRFNHAILCIPFESDTLWVECTSNQIPFGYIPPGNDNRYVLVVTDDGGFLTKTDKYSINKNKISSKIEAKIETEGYLKLNSNVKYEGKPYVYMISLANKPPEAQRREFIKSFSINNAELDNIEIVNNKVGIPVINKSFDVTIKQYFSSAGDRLFFHPNILNKLDNAPGLTNKRVNPIRLRESTLVVDTIRWEVPEDYSITHVPESLIIDNDFGFYSAEFEVSGNELFYYRKYHTKDGLFPPERYNEFAEFFMSVYNNDRSQVVIQSE